MKRDRYKSIFDNLTDLEFEEILEECGFKYTKVEGKGGLYINGKNITSQELKDEHDLLINKIEKIKYSKTNKLNKFTGETFDLISDDLDYVA